MSGHINSKIMIFFVIFDKILNEFFENFNFINLKFLMKI